MNHNIINDDNVEVSTVYSKEKMEDDMIENAMESMSANTAVAQVTSVAMMTKMTATRMEVGKYLTK